VTNNDDAIHRGGANAPAVAGQISQAVTAGLPLETGLRALAEQTRSGRTRRALMELSERLEQGAPLADAMHQMNTHLPHSMSVLVEAGLETGKLDSVMQYSVEQSRRASWLRREVWTSLAYPLFLMLFCALICSFILATIIPQFKRIFDDFGTELPGLTLVLIRFSDAFVNFSQAIGTPVFAIPIALCILFFLLGRSGLMQRWATSIPLFGTVFRLATYSEFCQILAILTEAKLPFSKALRFAGEASDDRWLIRKCQMMAHDVEHGSTPDEAALLSGLPNSLRQVFRHASSERTFVEALRGLSDLYAARCSVSSKLVSAILEPFALVIAMGFAGMTTIALFLPLIKLLNDLS
jgi:type IV pilus assembly protein PilC